MTNRVLEADPLLQGWTALRAFFQEGTPALQRAIEALGQAEADVRQGGDPSRLTLWLVATATALQHTRRPEAMETALARARELANLVARTQGVPTSVPDRTRVEAILRDLAAVVPAQAAEFLDEGLAYSDRTVTLARKASRDDWLGPALASRADLVLQRAPADRRSARRAVTLHEDARRRWPARDLDGRAQAALGYADVLLAVGDARRAEAAAREALGVFATRGDRFHEAAARERLARALLAQDRTEALDEQAAAVALYRTLGCRWEARRAEEILQ